jgi:hypothetical protein
MRLASFIALASAVVGTLAHLDMYAVWVNNIDQGNGRGIYVRVSSFPFLPFSLRIDEFVFCCIDSLSSIQLSHQGFDVAQFEMQCKR